MILPALKSLFAVLALTAALAPGGALPALAEAGSGAPAGRGHAAIGAGPARALVPVASLAALKYANLVRQRFDYSCGAAALATLLTYGYGHTVGEMDIIDKALATLSGDERSGRFKQGLSLLDLQRVAEAHGFRAQGFRLPATALGAISGPVMVFVTPGGNEHFAVLRGVRGGRVYLADPSRGNVRMPLYRFLREWAPDGEGGIVFAVEPEQPRPAWRNRLKPPAGPVRPELAPLARLLAIGERL